MSQFQGKNKGFLFKKEEEEERKMITGQKKEISIGVDN